MQCRPGGNERRGIFFLFVSKQKAPDVIVRKNAGDVFSGLGYVNPARHRVWDVGEKNE